MKARYMKNLIDDTLKAIYTPKDNVNKIIRIAPDLEMAVQKEAIDLGISFSAFNTYALNLALKPLSPQEMQHRLTPQGSATSLSEIE